jgi:hypothetical protein
MWGWWNRWKALRAANRAADEDRVRRAKLEQAAFADGRFVMYLVVGSRPAPVCFTPKESEAATFFRNYAVPWMRGTLQWLSHQSWDGGLPGGPVVSRSPFIEVFKGFDLRQIIILCSTSEYRDRLDNLLAEELRAAESKAEADRLATQATQYNTWVAAMRDAMKGEPG